jgi:hypothetical protein
MDVIVNHIIVTTGIVSLPKKNAIMMDPVEKATVMGVAGVDDYGY